MRECRALVFEGTRLGRYGQVAATEPALAELARRTYLVAKAAWLASAARDAGDTVTTP